MKYEGGREEGGVEGGKKDEYLTEGRGKEVGKRYVKEEWVAQVR